MNHLESAFKGSNRWYKYPVMFIATLIGGGFLGSIPLVIVKFCGKSVHEMNGDATSISDFSSYGIHPTMGLVLMMLPMLVGLWILTKLVKSFHNRTVKETINGTERIRWSRFFYAAGLWAMFSGIVLLVDYLFFPGDYTVRLNWSALIPLVFVSLLIIPFQTSFEELLFRGYLAQGVGVLFRNRFLTILIPAVLFALLHGINPEVDAYGFWYAMSMYLTFGFLFGITSVLDDGIEVAMGAHAANNVFLSIFVSTRVSAIQTPALLLDNTTAPSMYELFGFILISVVFVLILGYKYKWRMNTLFLPIEVKAQ